MSQNLENKKKQKTVKLILKFLRKNGYFELKKELEEKTNIKLEKESVSNLFQMIYSGEWEQSERQLIELMKECGNAVKDKDKKNFNYYLFESLAGNGSVCNKNCLKLVKPHSRSNHHLIYDPVNKYFWFSGGTTKRENYYDLWYFNLQDRKWSCVCHDWRVNVGIITNRQIKLVFDKRNLKLYFITMCKPSLLKLHNTNNEPIRIICYSITKKKFKLIKQKYSLNQPLHFNNWVDFDCKIDEKKQVLWFKGGFFFDFQTKKKKEPFNAETLWRLDLKKGSWQCMKNHSDQLEKETAQHFRSPYSGLSLIDLNELDLIEKIRSLTKKKQKQQQQKEKEKQQTKLKKKETETQKQTEEKNNLNSNIQNDTITNTPVSLLPQRPYGFSDNSRNNEHERDQQAFQEEMNLRALPNNSNNREGNEGSNNGLALSNELEDFDDSDEDSSDDSNESESNFSEESEESESEESEELEESEESNDSDDNANENIRSEELQEYEESEELEVNENEESDGGDGGDEEEENQNQRDNLEREEILPLRDHENSFRRNSGNEMQTRNRIEVAQQLQELRQQFLLEQQQQPQQQQLQQKKNIQELTENKEETKEQILNRHEVIGKRKKKIPNITEETIKNSIFEKFGKKVLALNFGESLIKNNLNFENEKDAFYFFWYNIEKDRFFLTKKPKQMFKSIQSTCITKKGEIIFSSKSKMNDELISFDFIGNSIKKIYKHPKSERINFSSKNMFYDQETDFFYLFEFASSFYGPQIHIGKIIKQNKDSLLNGLLFLIRKQRLLEMINHHNHQHRYHLEQKEQQQQDKKNNDQKQLNLEKIKNEKGQDAKGEKQKELEVEETTMESIINYFQNDISGIVDENDRYIVKNFRKMSSWIFNGKLLSQKEICEKRIKLFEKITKNFPKNISGPSENIENVIWGYHKNMKKQIKKWI